jgi:hypothetical protein
LVHMVRWVVLSTRDRKNVDDGDLVGKKGFEVGGGSCGGLGLECAAGGEREAVHDAAAASGRGEGQHAADVAEDDGGAGWGDLHGEVGDHAVPHEASGGGGIAGGDGVELYGV